MACIPTTGPVTVGVSLEREISSASEIDTKLQSTLEEAQNSLQIGEVCDGWSMHLLTKKLTANCMSGRVNVIYCSFPARLRK